MSMPFDCTLFEPPVPVTGLTTITAQDLVDWPPFKEWATSLKQALKLQNEKSHVLNKDVKLTEIQIQGVDMFIDTKIGFVKLKAIVKPTRFPEGTTEAQKRKIRPLPGITLLRGGSVAILMILHPPEVEKIKGQENIEAEEHAEAKEKAEPQVVFVIQPRISIGSLAFQELPAGMIDGGKAAGAVLKEVQEEVGVTIEEKHLDNMTELAILQSSKHWWSTAATAKDDEILHTANYPSAGGCDEAIALYLYQARVSKEDMEALKGKMTGNHMEGENIVTKLVPLKDVWKEGARDGKTLAALALYQNLKAAEKLKPLADATVKLEPTK